VHNITIKEVEQVAFSMAQELLAYDEPIPAYSTRYPGALESCLATPFQWFGGRSLYRGLASKSSTLFYLMVKNHPFLNGNKRIAITTLLVFLYLNNRWLYAELDEFYRFALFVAESNAKDKELVISTIKRFLKKHTKTRPCSTNPNRSTTRR
jgi:death-on-curing protein